MTTRGCCGGAANAVAKETAAMAQVKMVEVVEVEKVEEVEEVEAMAAREYLERHRLAELMELMMARVMAERPARPREMMLLHLQQLRSARDAAGGAPPLASPPAPTPSPLPAPPSPPPAPPQLFTPRDLRTAFGLADPGGHGVISLAHYTHVLQTLGAVGFDASPVGGCVDAVTLDTLTSEGVRGLRAAAATYST
ncbi:EF-hand calcium-binding domain-containing protein 10 [Lampetra fluviatilis]